jgi:hypothetical protein
MDPMENMCVLVFLRSYFSYFSATDNTTENVDIMVLVLSHAATTK